MLTNPTANTISNAVDIRDIKPPVEIPSGLGWLWCVLGGLIAGALIYVLWRYWRKRQLEIHAPPPEPAHVRAQRKLQQALALIGQPEPFVVAVSGVVRVYLEERFNLRAPERTTEEFLRELAESPVLSQRQKESLGDFLQRADLVKFARYEPGEPELRDMYTAAQRLIEETAPVEIKNEPEPQQSGNQMESELVEKRL